MKPEDKDLLLKDICSRLPYGVIMTNMELRETHYPLTCEDLHDAMFDDGWNDVPYLRSMSSMTEEEKKEYQSLCEIHFDNDADANFMAYYFDTIESFDWLNKNMFDHRDLIPKDCAIEVTEDNNPYKIE